MAALDYVYQDPQETYTIEQYIACQSDEVINYKNLSFVDKIHYPELLRDFHYSAYNVVSDYIEEIQKDFCVKVTLTSSASSADTQLQRKINAKNNNKIKTFLLNFMKNHILKKIKIGKNFPIF